MTRDQAKTKWCPFAIIRDTYGAGSGAGGGPPAGSSSAGVNRASYGAPQGTNCIANNCACWVDLGSNNGVCGLVTNQAHFPSAVAAPQ